MKKLLNLSLMALLLMGLLVGCDKDDDVDETDYFLMLAEFLEGGTNWVNDMTGWIVTYTDGIENDYFVLDIRSADDFNDVDDEYDLDHLEGAVNADMTTMWDAVDGVTGDILVVCYSGQSASYAHMLLRLKGYNAYVLKFGMSIVAAEHDKWSTNCSNEYADHENWVDDAAPELPGYEFPVLDPGGLETAEEILDAQIDVAIAAWPRLITAATVMEDPTLYNIVNYWGVADYDLYGHIAGAYQVDPKTLTMAENLSAFSPEVQNVIYCWTGQTGAAVAAYMTVIGYDIVDLKFGCNAMIYDELAGHKWPMPW